MDPLTQGVLGASFSQAFAKKPGIRVAALCGAIGGMAPDLDILLRSNIDHLFAIEYHRHFTHSLLFIPFGGFLVAALLWGAIFRKKYSFTIIYIFTTLGFATHGLLDASTSYGTRLLWPLSNERISWNIISIIDPIFTIPLLIFCIASVVTRSNKLIRLGLFISALYLAFGFSQHERAKSFALQTAQSRGHVVERILLNPTIGNNILWRSVYQSSGVYYIDAVYTPPFAPTTMHEGKTVPVIDKHTIFPELGLTSVQRQDILRFAYFSQDFIYLHPARKNMIADLRYGTLPNDDQSLWGIQLNLNEPDTHARFINLRHFEDKHYDEFWLMLNGEFAEQ